MLWLAQNETLKAKLDNVYCNKLIGPPLVSHIKPEDLGDCGSKIESTLPELQTLSTMEIEMDFDRSSSVDLENQIRSSTQTGNRDLVSNDEPSTFIIFSCFFAIFSILCVMFVYGITSVMKRKDNNNLITISTIDLDLD